MRQRVIIMGAAGRDFHDFNVCYRDDPRYEVVAFTAAQIPGIEGRLYPPELAGELYGEGIRIHPEKELAGLIRKHNVDFVHFAYSDIAYDELMHKASVASANGADFLLPGAERTMLVSEKTVIAVCAVRTGCGKSQTTRKLFDILRKMGKKAVVVRHPMPYGDLKEQELQRFASYEDLARHRCTIEEREEYEPLIEMGAVVFAGVDYAKILDAAEKEADVIIFDGGNNDTPFFRPDLQITLFDPHRAGDERNYYPGETNMRLADIAVIGKVDSAPAENVEALKATLDTFAPQADVLLAESEITVGHPEAIAGKRVLIVEDGPTLTHGGMAYGAGFLAAKRHGAAEIVDPRAFAEGELADLYDKYPHQGPVLPAIGYGQKQMQELEATINRADCDLVLYATPIALTRLLKIDKPALRVRYEYADSGNSSLEKLIGTKLKSLLR
jgi:predicted GTPase